MLIEHFVTRRAANARLTTVHRGARTADPTARAVASAAHARVRLADHGRRGSKDRGSNPVELAILLPIIVFALLASIQIALNFLARSEALAAAQQGVTSQRAYLARAGVGTQAADLYVSDGNGWLGGETSSANCPVPGSSSTTTPCTATSTTVTVTVTGKAISLVPGWSMTVSQSAHGEIERITQPDSP
jgi:TadE-like protein